MTERIVSHPSTQEYRDNFDRIFRKGSALDQCVESEITHVLAGVTTVEDAYRKARKVLKAEVIRCKGKVGRV